jgi:hypothetical protein
MKKTKEYKIDLDAKDKNLCRSSIHNEYKLMWFELMSFRSTKIVIYGVGQWKYHVMDWRGCNYYHGRLPGSPVFDNEKEAIKWLKWAVEKKHYQDGERLTGHHSGEYKCSACEGRDRGTIGFTSLKERSIANIYKGFDRN